LDALSFLWEHFQAGEHEKINEIIARPNFQVSSLVSYFLIIYMMSIHEYDRAQAYLDQALLALTKDREVFDHGDQHHVQDRHDYAQVFYECQEILDLMRSESSESERAAIILNRRLKFFHRNETMWHQIIALRSLVFPIESNAPFYLKIIAALRKNRYFSIIDRYFTGYFESAIRPDILVERIRITWARGERQQALMSAKTGVRLLHVRNQAEFTAAYQEMDALFPFAMFSRFSEAPSFDSDLERYTNDRLGGSTFEESLDALKKLSSDGQRDFFLDFVHTMPDRGYRCLRFVMDRYYSGPEPAHALHHLFAKYTSQLNFNSLEAFQNAAESAKIALDHNPNAYTTWCGWAFANLQICTILRGEDAPQTNPDGYGIDAVHGYLKAIELRPSASLGHFCLLFGVLFSITDPDLISEEIVNQLLAVPAPRIITMIPQITTQLSHCSPRIRQLAQWLLASVGRQNFQEVFFPLNLCAADGGETARETLEMLRESHEAAADDAELFYDGLVRCAVTWFESWKFALEEASHLEGRHDAILAEKFAEMANPKCEMDNFFLAKFGAAIKDCQTLFEMKTERSLHSMWLKLKQLYEQLKQTVIKLGIIIVHKISEGLARRRGFHLRIPGSGNAMLDYIEPIMEILGTQEQPRSTFFVGHDGQKVKFLLKGNEDLRLDERIMQFFGLVNTLLHHSKADTNFSVATYAIVPLSKQAGLIKWVTGADTLHQMLMDFRELRQIAPYRENDICHATADADFKWLNALQRLEMFEVISQDCRALELLEVMWLRSPNAALWVQRTERFTVSSALMSIIGYVIGLGDRHPSNIMIQRDTGIIVHIDFGEAFESAQMRNLDAERVPFRLTRLIVNALEGSMTDGLYEKMCVTAARLIRRHRVTLSAQLGIFLREPLGLERFASEKVLINRVFQKLQGTELGDDGIEWTPENQVAKLIRVAADPKNYVRHYPGWCPFW
jgi:hypothetical protein